MEAVFIDSVTEVTLQERTPMIRRVKYALKLLENKGFLNVSICLFPGATYQKPYQWLTKQLAGLHQVSEAGKIQLHFMKADFVEN